MSCENYPVWQQSRPSVLMDSNDELSNNTRYHRLSHLFARLITSQIRRAIICPGYRTAVKTQLFPIHNLFQRINASGIV